MMRNAAAGSDRETAQPGRYAGETDGRTLIEAVQVSVRQLDDGELTPPRAGSGPLPLREVLAVMVYCYATGVCGSQDVAQLMREDASLRHRCGGDVPDWRWLRRFRRENRDVLRHTLAETFLRTWSWMNGAHRGMSQPAPRAARAATEERPAADAGWCAWEADRLLEQAMFIDQMALD